jgi:CRISPR/Cas system CMR-associated protein Cmr5 small subunit
MNKIAIDRNLPYAYKAIIDAEISKDGKVNKSYRGQISTLGAAITMGSIKSAICFFSEKANNNSDVDRSKLLKAISYVLKNSEDTREQYKKVDDFKMYILNSDLDIEALKEDIVNAAIAIKLAMNLFEWEAA